MTIFHSKKPYGSEKFFTEPYGSSTFHQFPGLCPELPDPLSRHVRIKVAHASRMGLNRLHTGPGYRPGIYVRVKIRLNNILPKVESIFLSIKELFISQFQETYINPLTHMPFLSMRRLCMPPQAREPHIPFPPGSRKHPGTLLSRQHSLRTYKTPALRQSFFPIAYAGSSLV